MMLRWIQVNKFSYITIDYRKMNKTCILRSVDNYCIYDDDLSDYDNPQYTLFGNIGDQDENHWRNESLLNPNKTQHIYLYRVKKINSNKKEYIWYGKYEIVDKYDKQHKDKNDDMRKIIILKLKKISD